MGALGLYVVIALLAMFYAARFDAHPRL